MSQLRRPGLRYITRNGFAEFNSNPMSNPSETEMAEAQDFSLFVLEELGSELPS